MKTRQAFAKRSFLVMAVVITGSLQAQQDSASTTERQARGCYDVRIGEWIRNPGSEPPRYAVPQRIELQLVRVSDQTWRLSPPIPELQRPRPQPFPWPSWSLRGTDSLDLRWSTGFHGVSMRVGPVGRDELRGYAERFTDVIVTERAPDGTVRRSPRSRASVTLIRVPCS